MAIFVPSFYSERLHRGELLSFEPSENLENSTCTGKKSESCFSCSSIYTAHPAMGGGGELTYIYAGVS